MDIRIDDSCFDLRKAQILRLHDASGAAIVCLQGELWLTQDGDFRDIVLAAGDSFVLDRAGVTLVTALSASSVCVEKAGESRHASRAQGMRSRLSRSGVGSAPLPMRPFALRPL